MAVLTEEIRERLKRLADENGLHNLLLFGSCARGEENEDSDIDLLAAFPQDFTLLKHARLQREMSSIAKRPVDLVSRKALRPSLQEKVLKEAIPI
ncbi:MAG: nucleotidyltransferase family protein [Candidatus Sumerlaeia bacterium]